MVRLCAHALEHGGERISAFRVRWDISGDCRSGYERSIYGVPYSPTVSGHTEVRPGASHPLELQLTTRCRKCDKCRTARARMWRERMKQEIAAASRTWFCTWTLNVPAHHHYLNVARHRSDVEMGEFDARPEDERFRLVVSAIGEEITRYLKRVRKNSGARIRYCLVAERHKSGLPHFHGLIHERSKPVVKQVLKDAWRLGFSFPKLVENPDRAAWYVAKYLTKDASGRMRASAHYGTIEPVPFHTILDSLQKSIGSLAGEVPHAEGTAERSDETRQGDSLIEEMTRYKELAIGDF